MTATDQADAVILRLAATFNAVSLAACEVVASLELVRQMQIAGDDSATVARARLDMVRRVVKAGAENIRKAARSVRHPEQERARG